MEKHVALYREFRPKVFDDVIGQDHIIRILRNQIKNSCISHAYLFTGTRGTGKTTIAKIFAMSVNCENNVLGSPCYKCETCKALNSPNLDIYELDAASNNSVDQIRELLDTVRFTPVFGKYKVYIIDEVHMLSTSAFNALLKTLEEPPKHAIFILATTEPHKIPQTILSRCMRFDFKLVPSKLLVGNLEKILKQIGRTYDIEALKIIANIAQGSVRDSLSIADTVVSFCEDTITYDETIEILGISAPTTIIKMIGDILEENYTGLLTEYRNIINAGKNVNALLNDLLNNLFNLIYIKNCQNAQLELAIPEEQYRRLLEISKEYPNFKIINAILSLSKMDSTIKNSRIPELMLETGLIKAASISSNFDANSIILRMKKLEDTIKNLQSNGVAYASASKSKPIDPTRVKQADIIRKLNDYFIASNDIRKKALYSISENSYIEGDVFHMKISDKSDFEMLNNMEFRKKAQQYLEKEGSNLKNILVEYDETGEDKLKDLNQQLNTLFNKDVLNNK